MAGSKPAALAPGLASGRVRSKNCVNGCAPRPEPDGYYVYRSRTNNVFVFYRGFFTDPKDLSGANQLIASTRIYPYGERDMAAAMKFPDGSATPANMLFPADGSYFDMLARFVADDQTALAGEIDAR